MNDSKMAFLGTAAAAAAAVVPEAPPVILGAQLPLLLAAFAGGLFSLAQTPPEKWGTLLSVPAGVTGWRRAFHALSRGSSIMFALTGVAFVSAWIVPFGPFVWEKLKDAPLAAGAGILAWCFQQVVPRVVAALGRRIDAWGAGKPAEGPKRE